MKTTHFDTSLLQESNQELAVDRTVFAFERTALAYFRTGSTFLIAALTLIKLFEEAYMNIFGLILLPAAAYMYILGIQKFNELNVFVRNK
ncbi:DUF202 domain-containing protein [Candidatus Roizmanbacteria bacterium]|nr:MAG: DUF202 domain-containing protein [Candidatus Roizmanbacteria bacterium]